MNEFRNLYLLAGLCGGFETNGSINAFPADTALLHTLDAWGVQAPWGPCDSGVDLDSPGDGVLRGWCHVDLRGTDEAPRGDVPLSGLLRTMWDALELYGQSTLTGIDAIVPLECAGEAMLHRVFGSVIRDRRASERPASVLIQVHEEYSEGVPDKRDPDAAAAALSELVEVQAVMGDVPLASPSVSFKGSPFSFGVERRPWLALDTDPFRAEVRLPVWTIDDAAWLAEAVTTAYTPTARNGEVQVAVRRLARPSTRSHLWSSLLVRSLRCAEVRIIRNPPPPYLAQRSQQRSRSIETFSWRPRPLPNDELAPTPPRLPRSLKS